MITPLWPTAHVTRGEYNGRGLMAVTNKFVRDLRHLGGQLGGYEQNEYTTAVWSLLSQHGHATGLQTCKHFGS